MLTSIGTAAVGLAGVGAASAQESQEDGGGGFVVRQNGRCIPVTPISGDAPVREFYDWGHPEPDSSPYAVNWGTTYSSRGTREYQRPNTSILMLYDGPDGVSLVAVHGMYFSSEQLQQLEERGDLENLNGGSVTFNLLGLPEDGEWAVIDDQYDAPENYDRFEFGDTMASMNWTWGAGRTDGMAFRGLTGEETIELIPGFNEAAALYGDQYDGTVESWDLVTGDPADPERIPLQLDERLTIEGGACEPDGSGRTPTARPG